MKRVPLFFLLLMVTAIGCLNEQPYAPPIEPTETAPIQTAVAISAETTRTDNTGNADVEYVRVVATNDNTYTFHVTVAHPDTGWDDYADGWDVVLPDGTVVKPDPESPFTRLLLHPHENEQPFTRSQAGVVISAEITTVTVRAHDLVAGFGGAEVIVDLSQDAGEKFKIER